MTDVTVNTKGVGIIDKDPDAVLDYLWNWTAWLADVNDTIVSASFPTPTGGVIVDSHSVVSIDPDVNNGVLAWISGGNLDETAEVTCRIVTAGGRTEDRTLKLKIRER